jgi:polysaccharide biosynthesis transport protein
LHYPSPYFIQRDTSPASSVDRTAIRPASTVGRVRLSNRCRIFRQHWQLITATTIGALILCGLYLVVVAPVYTASSTILIEPLVEASNGIQGGASRLTGQLWPQGRECSDALKTQCNILQSQSLAARVIQDLKLADRDLFIPRGPNRATAALSRAFSSIVTLFNSRRVSRDHPEIENGADASGSEVGGIGVVDPTLISAYLQRLNIRANDGSNLITVSFSAPDPVLSARIVNAHVSAFVAQEVDLRDQANRNAQKYIAQRVAELKNSLDKSEALLDQYRREHGTAPLSPQDPGQQQIQLIKNFNSELAQAVTARMMLQAAHQLIVAKDYESLPQVSANSLVQNLKQETAQLATQYASMGNRFNPGYHPLDDLKARLVESQDRLDKEVGRIARGIEAQYQAALAGENKLQGEIEAIKTEAKSLNDASLEDAKLSREVSNSRHLYNSALQRMNELGMMSSVYDSAIAVVDSARPPQSMSSPRKSESVLLALTLGLVTGLGTALILESLDDGLKSRAEVEGLLDLPILGVVPDFRKLDDNGYTRRKYVSQWMPIPVLGRAIGSTVGAKLLVSKSESIWAEAYRAMRTALLYSRAGSPPKTIGITSSIQGEGKTVSTINLSVCFAQLGSRILLIDADLRRPRCHRILGLENANGLSEVLVGQLDPQKAIRPTAVPGVSLISAGSPAPNPTELLDSSLLRDLLAIFSERFDHVFIDTPPIIPVSDAVIIATMVDGILMIAATDTPRQVVSEACSRLQYVGAKVLGMVLNKMDITSPDYRYHNGYSCRYSKRSL